MGKSSTQVRMSTALVWLLLVLHHTQQTSCDQVQPVTCHNSGDEKNYENVHEPNEDPKTYSCGDIKEDHEKEKYTSLERPIFRGVYTFPVDPIPRRSCFDEEAMDFLQKGLPVVLENCTFHKSAMKWTIEYLTENLQDEDHTAYLSKNRKFLYYDDDRIIGAYKEWKPPTRKLLMYFKNFSELMADLDRADNGSRAYFQSLLYLQDGVSNSMLADIDSFNYTWLLELVKRLDWGEDVTNLLLVGMPDVVTPAHFDILENLYVQIFGRKRVILFSPDYFRSLYPYPVGHPHDRQTQVDFDKPDLNKFPRFGEIRGMEVALEPDEVLYIPNYWWHYIESENHSKTISMNFWFDPKNATKANSDKGLQKSDPASVETEAKKNQGEDGNVEMEDEGNPPAEDTTSEKLPTVESGDSKPNAEQSDEAEDDAKKVGNEEKGVTTAEEGAENQQDEKEIILSAAQYLALIRDTETSLFRATLSHEKVKQILEELLTGRFDYLQKH